MRIVELILANADFEAGQMLLDNAEIISVEFDSAYQTATLKIATN